MGARGTKRFRVTLDVTVDLDSWEMAYGTDESPKQVAETITSWAGELLTDQLDRSGISPSTVTVR